MSPDETEENVKNQQKLKTDPAKARAELEGGVIGVVMGLMEVPDMLVVKLHEVVPERGGDLWRKFTIWRDAQPDEGGHAPFKKWVGTVIANAILGAP